MENQSNQFTFLDFSPIKYLENSSLEMCELAIQQNEYALQYVKKETQTEDFCKFVIQSDCSNIYKNLKKCFGIAKTVEIVESDCCICLRPIYMEDEIITKCLHVIHEKCIKQWIDVSDTCPMCRCEYPIK